MPVQTMKYPSSIQNLIQYFSKLPSVGPKTAERYVFHLLKKNPEALQAFAQAIAELKEKTAVCKICLNYAESDPCHICSDPARDKNILCIVSDARDMSAIESIGRYKGRYFILGGLISAIDEIGPDDINIKNLLENIKKNKYQEIILALSPNLEGETTVLYLIKLLKSYPVRITRLARGLPMGSDLEYADELTLANALKYRSEPN